MRALSHRLTGLALGLSLLSCASAQNFPQRPIQLIVPVSAGGGTDVMAGAGGNIGVEFVAKAKADGYTLLFSPSTIATNVAVYRKLPYDLLKDFQTVAMVGQTDVALVVHPCVKANTL